MKNRFNLNAVLLSAVLALTACGGGGSSSDTPPAENVVPVANAGKDKVVNEGGQVTLDGSGTDSDGTVSAYSWSQAAGKKVPFNGFDDKGTISFKAPATTEVLTLEFQLVVTDNGGAKSTPDSVKVTVNPVNEPPVADAGADREVDSASEVTLAGRGSDPDGEISGYAWKQQSGPAVELVDADKATLEFEAPLSADEELTLEFEFTVTDNEGASSSDIMVVTVIPANAPNLVLAFPPESGAYLEEDIAVFGTVEAKNGAGIVSLTINAGSLEQEVALDGSGSWRVDDFELPDDVEEFEIVVTAKDSAGLERRRVSRLITDNSAVGQGESWRDSIALALDTEAGTGYLLTGGVFVSDVKIVPLNLRTGERGKSITDFANENQGPTVTAFKHMILDKESDRLLLSVASAEPYAAILAVDLESGIRSVISDSATGAGETFALPVGLALGAEGLLYVADNNKDTGGDSNGAIFTVDMTTGERAIIAGSATNDYPIQVPLHLTWQADQSRLLFTENLALDAPVLALDLSDDPAASALVTYNDMNDDVPIKGGSQGIVVNSAGDTAYVMNGLEDNIIGVDLAAGGRTLVASDVTGTRSGILDGRGFAFDSGKDLLYVAGDHLSGSDALFVIDPLSGDKVVLSH